MKRMPALRAACSTRSLSSTNSVRSGSYGSAARFECCERLAGPGQPVNAARVSAVQRRDIELKLARPVLHAIPVERAGARAQSRLQCRARLGEAHHATGGVGLRHDLAPQMVVKAKIEQRAVEVEQRGINALPVRGLSALGFHGGIICSNSPWHPHSR